MTNTVYAVGHSSRSFDEVLTMLRNNKVTHLITDALIVAGADVVDIMSTTTVKPAVLNEHAHVQDGHITYPLAPRTDTQ